MTPDFTLIWPLSCLKDGVHLCRDSGIHIEVEHSSVTA